MTSGLLLRPLAFLLRFIVDSSVAIAIILFIPGLPPYLNFESYIVTPAVSLEGKLAVNGKLDKAFPILDNKILGPESIAIRRDEIYTGIIGGQVIRFRDGEMEVIAKFGVECEGQWEESKCGRPLGMRFNKAGLLVVADAYYGIFEVDVDSGKFKQLVSMNDTIQGKKPMNPNDLDISEDGTIYFSDSSTNVNLQDGLIEALGPPSGRLIKYDPKTSSSEVLLDGIHFANGVQLSKSEDFIVVSETVRSRVLRYYLKGPRKGENDVFVDGLPGSPDNIRLNNQGRFYISLVAPRYSHKLSAVEFLAPLPLVRKFSLRLICLVKGLLSGIQSVASIEFVDKAQYWLGHLEPTTIMFPKHAIIVEVDENGKFVSSLQSKEEKVAHISEITIDGDNRYAYLGSPYNTKIWKVEVANFNDNKKMPEVTIK